MDTGIYKIKCMKAGGLALEMYSGFALEEGQEIDLVNDDLPETIKCNDWWTADVLCRDPNLEIAQLIVSGDIVVIDSRKPDLFEY